MLGMILNILWLALLLFWFISSWRTKKRSKTPAQARTKSVAIRLGIAILIISLVQIPSVGREMAGINLGHTILGSTAIRLAAFGLAICGMLFALWARITIGRNWGVPMSLRENHELVTSGPYAWVRHPIYSGLWLAMAGSGLFYLATFFTFIALLLTIYYIIAAFREERTMLETFPQQYPQYQKQTKMFIPFIF
jgi:protein-S-isoprenylcysteine O-methyltransferase Ste14